VAKNNGWGRAIEVLYVLLALVLVGLTAYFSYLSWGVVGALVAPILLAIVMAIVGYFLFEYEH
jgi:hypothetical protein